MAAHYTFRDAQLRSFPLRALNLVGGWLERLGKPLPVLDPDGIVELARKEAGSKDLGSDSYREPLERYLRAAREEAELNAFGRLAVRGMLTRALTNRIKLHQWAEQHPEIREERIEKPWVIVGLPRTGSSLLSILLGLDPLARPPLHWEAADLIPPAGLATAASDPRIQQNQRETDRLHALNPPFACMHPTGATLAQECVAFFMYDVRTLGVETQAHVPSYGRWLESCDMNPAYTQHRLALQALQAAQPTERWILKTPNHLWCLPTLLQNYPDARIIWTHRDPGPITVSLASLVNTLQRMFTHRQDPKPAAEEWKCKMRHALDTGMKFDASAPDDWCFHVHYDDLTADPVGVVRRIHEHFGEELSRLHERRIQAWMGERHESGQGRHVYDPADFGWSYESLAAEFSGYTERFGINTAS
jgi:hypothetical protein